MEKKRITAITKACAALLVLLAMVLTVIPETETEAAAVALNSKSKTLYVGKTFQLQLKNYKKTVEWTSSNEAVATVDGTGLVTAVKKGNAVITATTAKGTEYTCKIKVKNPYVNPKKATLAEGETLQLKMVGAEAVSYSSGSKSNVTVSKTGLVTAIKATTKAVTIKVKCDNGKTYKTKITVTASNVPSPGGQTADSGDKTGDEVEYYGILNPKPKTDYVKDYVYDEVITTEAELVKQAAIAFDKCPETFKLTVSAELWDEVFEKAYKVNNGAVANRFYEIFACYSAFGSHANQYHYSWYPALITTITFKPVYKDGWKAVALLRYNNYEADDTVKKILSICEGIVKDAVAESSDLKKQILYINNRLCDMAEYDEKAAWSSEIIDSSSGVEKVVPAHDATGILLEGKGVCESYASAFEVCMNILGVDNYIMTNKEGYHVWNRVKVDGKWLNIDVTWNDGENGKIYNDFFLLPDAEFESTTKKTGNSLENHSAFTEYLPE